MKELEKKYKRKLERAQAKVQILEKMIEEKTFDLYNKNQNLERALAEKDELIREIQSAREYLIQTEKLAAIGEFTAGITHEINNPLNYIQSNAEAILLNTEDLKDLFTALSELDEENYQQSLPLLQQKMTEIDLPLIEAELQQLTQSILKGAHRMRQILKSVQFMAYKDRGEKQNTNIHELLEASLVLLHSRIKGSIQVEKRYGQIPEIPALPGQLSQVFINIIGNAVYALGDSLKGKIVLETRSEGNSICIGIKDNGVGMDEKTREKVFDSFFTTKEIGVGTGLGLAISKKIIEKHNGTIEVESTRGKGSYFLIRIPIK
jgi:two-component system NtrC family sensor kinase